jgi:hypothetical protein
MTPHNEETVRVQLAEINLKIPLLCSNLLPEDTILPQYSYSPEFVHSDLTECAFLWDLGCVLCVDEQLLRS